MTEFSEELADQVVANLDTAWAITDGRVVPTSADLSFGVEARRLDATYLYADMADSTTLAQNFPAEVAARVIRTYVNGAATIIKRTGGHIRSFDGDRVMGIYIGNGKNSTAARAALQINWLVDQLIRKRIAIVHPELAAGGWTFRHRVGVDNGEALVIRGGVRREHSDLISVGAAPNIAAKLSSLTNDYEAMITWDVYYLLNKHSQFNAVPDGEDIDMWEFAQFETIGGKEVMVYGSHYIWTPYNPGELSL